jgi:hypothetical protein
VFSPFFKSLVILFHFDFDQYSPMLKKIIRVIDQNNFNYLIFLLLCNLHTLLQIINWEPTKPMPYLFYNNNNWNRCSIYSTKRRKGLKISSKSHFSIHFFVIFIALLLTKRFTEKNMFKLWQKSEKTRKNWKWIEKSSKMTKDLSQFFLLFGFFIVLEACRVNELLRFLICICVIWGPIFYKPPNFW